MTRSVGLLLFVLTLVGLTACTKTKSQKLGICADDVEKFCADVKPGGGRIIGCLEEHRADLGPACLAANDKRKEKNAAASLAAATAPAVCTAEKPCKDEPVASKKDAKNTLTPLEEAKVKMATGEKAASSASPPKKK